MTEVDIVCDQRETVLSLRVCMLVTVYDARSWDEVVVAFERSYCPSHAVWVIACLALP